MKDYPNGKLCGRCGEVKPKDAFGTRWKTKSNGKRYLFIRTWCKDCSNEYSSTHRKPQVYDPVRRKELYEQKRGEKLARVCPICRRSFMPLRRGNIHCSKQCYSYHETIFLSRKCIKCDNSFDGKNRNTCDDCIAERRREDMRQKRANDSEFNEREKARLQAWKDANPDKVKAKYKLKGKEHARKRRNIEKNLPATLTEAEWHLALEYFEWCCAYCGNDGELHREHFIPMAKGGGYTADNIVPACPDCNLDKLDTLPLEWLIMQDRGLFKYVQVSQYLERM